MKTFNEMLLESERDKEMISGVVTLLKMVKDKSNRKEMAEYMLKDFEKEKITIDKEDFFNRCDLSV